MSGDDLRPLSARALKSAMDSLRPVLQGARVLDLFSGQGRFGISALEEGAEHAVFVEKHRATAQSLRKALVRHTARANLVCDDALHYLETNDELFDIVFADPPFRLWTEEFWALLEAGVAKHLKRDSNFLVKYPKRMVPFGPSKNGIFLRKTSVFGESQLLYYRYGEEKS